QIVASMEQQVQAGALAPSGLLPVRISAIRQRLDRADAERLSTESQARVAEGLGVTSAALQQIAFSLDSIKRPESAVDLTSAQIKRAALESRADILQALAEYAATQSALQLQIAKQYPDVHLQPGYQF